MHSHIGLVGLARTPVDLATDMRTHTAPLVAWKLVADLPWLAMMPQGIVQRGTPSADELWSHFQTSIQKMLSYAQRSNLALVRTAADIDPALAGKASVILASEGADFLGGRIELLKTAFDLGLRHLQLVHYIRTPVGDFSTESPQHHGLSPMGRELIKACEALGILVDLAHCSANAIDHALEIATKPMIWSHGWVQGDGGSPRDPYGFLKRRLSVKQAQQIAAKGGVIGLWGLGVQSFRWGWNVGLADPAGYATELAQLAERLGEDHVALGTDLAGVGESWSVNNYGHVRQVIQSLETHKLSRSTIAKIASGNFARVLKATLPQGA
jgi:membrane dipeptidase